MEKAPRSSHRLHKENEIVRKREKEFRHDLMWGSTEKYFKQWEEQNSKFDAWTSPRYYDENNRLVTEMKSKREKEDLLLKRREKLRKLLEEEDKSFEVELMVKKSKETASARSKSDEIPTEILKDIHNSFKLEEENRRRHEAEMRLYNRWRNNNSTIKNAERQYQMKNVKMAWLDQQIEKRMLKEKEEEENRQLLQERERKIKMEQQKEEESRRLIEEKNQLLKSQLQEQIQELQKRKKLSDELKRKEEEQMKRQLEVAQIEEEFIKNEKRRKDREFALYNINQYKMKLKQKALDIEENLKQECELLERLKKLDINEIITDNEKNSEIRQGISEFLSLVKAQKELEIRRQRQLEFIFDSEAQKIYEKQNQIWLGEELAREKLMKDVLASLKIQIEYNLEANKKEQTELLKEREEITKKVEEIDKEVHKLQLEENEKIKQTLLINEDEIKYKALKKREEENLKLKEINEELERVRMEEKRLQQEIINLQKKHIGTRPNRSRIFF